jgi:hypothetical protein
LRAENEHSTKEIEHRFTAIEEFAKESKEDRNDLYEIVETHTEKLATHEKAILAILIGMATLLQDKFPKLASALLKGLN